MNSLIWVTSRKNHKKRFDTVLLSGSNHTGAKIGYHVRIWNRSANSYNCKDCKLRKHDISNYKLQHVLRVLRCVREMSAGLPQCWEMVTLLVDWLIDWLIDWCPVLWLAVVDVLCKEKVHGQESLWSGTVTSQSPHTPWISQYILPVLYVLTVGLSPSLQFNIADNGSKRYFCILYNFCHIVDMSVYFQVPVISLAASVMEKVSNSNNGQMLLLPIIILDIHWSLDIL